MAGSKQTYGRVDKSDKFSQKKKNHKSTDLHWNPLSEKSPFQTPLPTRWRGKIRINGMNTSNQTRISVGINVSKGNKNLFTGKLGT